MELSGKAIRKVILEQSYRAGVGHIGCALSVADILSVLFSKVLRLPSPKDPNRDRFLLSKGHAALALYAALHLKGLLSKAELNSYCADGSILGVHPEYRLPLVDFSTGSLGMGLCYATGAALAAQIQGSSRRVYVLLSDAECNEGSLWEAVMFAAHHRLSNLTAIVDLNGQQAFGFTKDVLSLEPLSSRWLAMGWGVQEADGHDPSPLTDALLSFDNDSPHPRVILARTTFGKGVSFMENKIHWHYWPMNDAEYRQALDELESRR